MAERPAGRTGRTIKSVERTITRNQSTSLYEKITLYRSDLMSTSVVLWPYFYGGLVSKQYDYSGKILELELPYEPFSPLVFNIADSSEIMLLELDTEK